MTDFYIGMIIGSLLVFLGGIAGSLDAALLRRSNRRPHDPRR